jgi:DNA topoisomerase-2
MSSSNSSELANKYQQKSDKEHILSNPDTYIGSIENIESESYIFCNEDIDNNKIISKNISINPGLYKLFDEGIVNCRDHAVRCNQALTNKKENALPVTYIDVGINETDGGIITLINDGNGIDIAKHPEYDLWIPEMIFGHLRTSTNYDKTEKKIVGGKNGFGFKLVLIWSTWGMIETVDHVRGLKYTQEFHNNLSDISPPKIVKCKTKPYTKVSFKPDYARLGVSGLTPDFINYLKRRVYDIAAITDKSVKVKYNGIQTPINNFQQYIDLYIGNKTDKLRVYEEANERWEYAVCLAPNDEFTQVSFVNGIYTSKGGKHVEYIINQIIRKLQAYILKKKKVDVKPTSIKEQLMIFLRCDIENPAFDSQTKDYMNTSITNFGSTCNVSDKFVEKIAKMGVMDSACALTEVKETKAAKKNDGSKTRSIRGIPKLIDANYAGSAKSHECTIIFCEGDSAKAGIVSGLSKEDRNTIGVYPMRGKLFNVRGEQSKRIYENKEINEIKQILGLESGKKYTDKDVEKYLRYGKIIFMTDQDLDGSHIKGLGLNLFESEWESLSKIDNFIGFMNTPILKAKKGNQTLMFYNDGEYQKWKSENDTKGWSVKYYKGLGTSTSKEFKEYFEHKKIVTFINNGDESVDAIDMVFNKKRADDRKKWLENYNRELYLDTNKQTVSFKEFIDSEMIHFSKYDCDRSIPNVMDGLKISLRKILYAAFKKRLNTEIKVAQFSGYVSENSAYHHGEQSLNGAIVGMAQNFVGSNNINLFEPSGQFGTRLQGGKDSASERYIYTYLNKLTRCIFPEADDKILKYLDDDGYPVEPIYYVPIIPMLLVNGSKGIGTGFSTDIMCYNVLDIIQYIESKLKTNPLDLPNIVSEANTLNTIRPYYQGFTGTITKLNPQKYLIKGRYEKINDNTIRVIELPVGFWTDDFKEHLEYLIEGPPKEKETKESKDKEKDGAKSSKTKTSGKTKTSAKSQKQNMIKDYIDLSTDVNVDVTISFNTGVLDELIHSVDDNGCNGLEKLLKLYTTQSTTNMHAFDSKERLKKYESVEEIIDDFYNVRYEFYDIRKNNQIDLLNKELVYLSNKAKYISEILSDTLDLRKKKKDEIITILKEKEYDIVDDDEDYKYLVKMPMDSVSEENITKLMNDKNHREQELEILKNKSISEIWLEELENLKNEYLKIYQTTSHINTHSNKKQSKSQTNSKTKPSTSTKTSTTTKKTPIIKFKVKKPEETNIN